MQDDLIESINKMIVNGNRLELPTDEIFKNYKHVKKALIDAGGVYKRSGFNFSEAAQLIKDRLVGGELVNDKKKFQFFSTPPELAQHLVDLADINENDVVLEPSAGQGAISNIIRDVGSDLTVVELMGANIKVLSRLGYDIVEGCFLEQSEETIGTFNKIVANPPFTKNQDIDHISKMYELLDHGGMLVSMASRSWITGSQKKQVAFRDWLDRVGGIYTDVDAGAFKSSGTNIATVIVEISK